MKTIKKNDLIDLESVLQDNVISVANKHMQDMIECYGSMDRVPTVALTVWQETYKKWIDDVQRDIEEIAVEVEDA